MDGTNPNTIKPEIEETMNEPVINESIMAADPESERCSGRA